MSSKNTIAAHNAPTAMGRREMIGKLAALLAAGLWPGALQAASQSPRTSVGSLTFTVANDFHHDNTGCDEWFKQLCHELAAQPDARFCLALGDFANTGKRSSIEAIRDTAKATRLEIWPTPGNHDNDIALTTAVYLEVFPKFLNYTFQRDGWQFVGIDTTQGKDFKDTLVSEATLQWLDDTLPGLDPSAPTILFTHFPLAAATPMCPRNAEDVLARFLKTNLRAVFSGHHHGQTFHQRGEVALVTNVCCSRVKANHDGDLRKGYWLVRADNTQSVTRQLIEFHGPSPTPPA